MLFLKKYFWPITLIALTALAAVLRLVLLEARPMDQDELARVVPEFTPTSIIPPGILLITRLSASLLNYSDAGYRAPIFIAGVIGIPLIYSLGRAFFGRISGITSAFILTLLLTHIDYSNQTKEYVPLITFTILSSLLLFRVISKFVNNKSIRKIDFLFLAFTSLVGVLFSSYFYVLVFAYQTAIILLLIAWKSRQRFSLRRLISQFPLNIILGAGLLLLVFLGVSILSQADKYFGIKVSFPDVPFLLNYYWPQVSYFITRDASLSEKSDTLFFIGVLFLFLIKKFRPGAAYVLIFTILDSLIVSSIKFSHMAFPFQYPRYHAFILPLYIIILSGLFEVSVDYLRRKPTYIKNLVIGIVISLPLLYFSISSYKLLKIHYYSPYQPIKTSFKDVGQYLNEHMKSGDTLVRRKNFGMDHKFNQVNRYIDKDLFNRVRYSIFTNRFSPTNWYVSSESKWDGEPIFPGFLTVERIRPSLKYTGPLVSELKYINPFIRTRRLTDYSAWRVSASANQDKLPFAFDGDVETRWVGSNGKPSELIIDLGSEKTLNSINFLFDEPYLYPKNFALFLSEDGTDKQKIFEYPDAEPAKSYPNSEIYFQPAKARYILVTIIGSGIREIRIREVYEERTGIDNDSISLDTGSLTGYQIKDPVSPNGFAQLIPYQKDDDYTFYQIGDELGLKEGDYKASFKIKVDRIDSDWKSKLPPPLTWEQRLDYYLESKDVSDSDILYISLESTRGTFYNSPAYLNVRGEDFKEANKYYNYSITFHADGKERLYFQAFNPKHRRYPANLYVTYPKIEKIK